MRIDISTSECNKLNCVPDLAHLLVIPCSPALVDDLAPADTASACLREVARETITRLKTNNEVSRVSIIGQREQHQYTALTGSLAPWGSMQAVESGNYLCDLLGHYICEPVLPDVEIQSANELVFLPGTLNVLLLDASAGLTAKAPFAECAGAAEATKWCREVLARGHREYAGDLSAAGLPWPAGWSNLHGVDANKRAVLAQDETHGVARFIAFWEGISRP